MAKTVMPRRSRPSENSRLIWETVRQIPTGKVATYGEIAKVSGLIGQARLVGQALHSLPSDSGVPWHRVINSEGKISLPKAYGGYAKQKRLLKREGVVFKSDAIDMEEYGWLRSLEEDGE